MSEEIPLEQQLQTAREVRRNQEAMFKKRIQELMEENDRLKVSWSEMHAAFAQKVERIAKLEGALREHDKWQKENHLAGSSFPTTAYNDTNLHALTEKALSPQGETTK